MPRVSLVSFAKSSQISPIPSLDYIAIVGQGGFKSYVAAQLTHLGPETDDSPVIRVTVQLP
jgi:hypothetical protein